ncbi:MAG: LysR family transcriptional regulator [Legionellales bacterium]|nr:LysR family transcriptional regulator [Legionellales bacterium]
MHNELIGDVLLFIEVVKAGSLSAAARRMGISKPSVSRRLTQLETTLKNLLIKRTTRKLSLTETGKILFDQCSEISTTFDEAIQEITAHKTRQTGKIKIGFSSYFANDYRASQMIAKFMQLHPEISVELHSFTTSQDIDLIGKDFDLYFTDNDLSGAKLISNLYCKYKLICCASPEYIKHHGAPNLLTDLAKHNCLLHYLYEQPVKQWPYYEKEKLKFIEVNGNFCASRSHLLLKMARAGVGITLLPEFEVSRYIKSKELIVLLKQVKFQDAEVYVTRYRHKNIAKKLQLFLDHIKSSIIATQEVNLVSNIQQNFYHYLP